MPTQSTPGTKFFSTEAITVQDEELFFLHPPPDSTQTPLSLSHPFPMPRPADPTYVTFLILFSLSASHYPS